MKAVKKPIAKPAFNIHHEDVKHKIEKAFKSGTTQYYKFIEDAQIPSGRYKYIYAFLKEADLRMSLETLKQYIETLKNILNGGGKKNQINVGDIWRIVLNIESRIVLAFEPASIERLASVIYFDDTEELSTYSKDYGQAKINLWSKNKTADFFLTKPIVELLGLKNISLTSLEDYLKETATVIQDLTQDLQMVSSENSSESGKKT